MLYGNRRPGIGQSWIFKRFLIGFIAFILIFCIFIGLTPKLFLNRYISRRFTTEKQFTAAQFGLTENRFQVETSDGLKIYGEEFTVNQPKACVILSSGAENPSRNSLYGHARLLNDEGYAVFLYDARAHNSSEGTQCGYGITEYRDILAVTEYIRSFTTYLNLPIILMGWNTGAVASLYAAEKCSSVSAVYACGCYEDTEDYFLNLIIDDGDFPGIAEKILQKLLKPYLYFTYGKDALELSPEKIVSKLTVPVFFAGTADIEIGVAKELYNLLDEKLQRKSILTEYNQENPYGTDQFLTPQKESDYAKDILNFFSEVVDKNNQDTEA